MSIEKAEPALGGISIEYSDWQEIEKDADEILDAMNIHGIQYRLKCVRKHLPVF